MYYSNISGWLQESNYGGPGIGPWSWTSILYLRARGWDILAYYSPWQTELFKPWHPDSLTFCWLHNDIMIWGSWQIETLTFCHSRFSTPWQPDILISWYSVASNLKALNLDPDTQTVWQSDLDSLTAKYAELLTQTTWQPDIMTMWKPDNPISWNLDILTTWQYELLGNLTIWNPNTPTPLDWQPGPEPIPVPGAVCVFRQHCLPGV